jgi:predicted AAA+ superfamily ATPase
VLILLDELSKYLDFVKDDSKLLEKVKHFIHVLSLAVGETDTSVLVVSVAGDVYETAAEQVRRELGDAMNLLKRKMQSYEPVRSEDVPGVLRKRLFATANLDGANEVAEAYMELYKHIHAPDRFQRAELRKRIAETYPFHPELIDILYDRVSTIPDFQRTRGALRLLANALRKVWNDKEADAFLIQPYHIDLAEAAIVYELTSRLKEDLGD